MEFQYLGTLAVTPDWQWLLHPVTDRETFKIVHHYNYPPAGYAFIAQAFPPDMAIATPKKVYARNNPSIIYLHIPPEIYQIEERNRYIGVKFGGGYLFDEDLWSVDIHQLIIP